MRKLVLFCIVICFIGTSIVPNICGTQKLGIKELLEFDNAVLIYLDDQLDQQQTEYLPYSGETPMGVAIWLDGNNDGLICAQSFRPSLSVLTRVQLWVSHGPSPMDCDLIVSIRSSLDGDDLTSVSVSPDDIPLFPTYEWINFDFTDVEVTPGEIYFIVARCECGDGTPEQINVYGWAYGCNTSYILGDAYFSYFDNFTEPSWELYGCHLSDTCFKTYGSNGSPNIEVDNIEGGFRVSAVITNNGTATATDVNWSIDLEGGLIVAGDHTEGVISELAPGATKTIRQTTLYGIGRTTITVTAGDASKTATGFVLGPLVLGVN